jgi:hypothetical protein
MKEDEDNITAGIVKSSRETQNFILAVLTELDDNPSILKELSRSYKGQ